MAISVSMPKNTVQVIIFAEVAGCHHSNVAQHLTTTARARIGFRLPTRTPAAFRH